MYHGTSRKNAKSIAAAGSFTGSVTSDFETACMHALGKHEEPAIVVVSGTFTVPEDAAYDEHETIGARPVAVLVPAVALPAGRPAQRVDLNDRLQPEHPELFVQSNWRRL